MTGFSEVQCYIFEGFNVFVDAWSLLPCDGHRAVPCEMSERGHFLPVYFVDNL
jgi:hypothetical protein